MVGINVFQIWMIYGYFVLSISSVGSIPIAMNKKSNTTLLKHHHHEDCLKYSRQIELFSNTIPPPDTIDFFEPFLFRANNYGIAQYKLESTYLGLPIMNIRMNPGPKPDTVKGGDLNGFYIFYKSFLIPRWKENPSQIKLNNGNRVVFEIWNVYLSKNNSMNVNPETLQSYKFISLNVLFEIGNKSNIRLDPIIKSMKKLSSGTGNHSTKSKSISLPINYDPYGLLPLQGSFAIYETSNFPFHYPTIKKNNTNQNTQTTNKNPCEPLVKVYLYDKRLQMSEEQLNEFIEIGSHIKMGKPNNNMIQQRTNDDDVVVTNFSHSQQQQPKIYYTPQSNHLIFRRMVPEKDITDEEVSSDNEYYDDDPEEDDDFVPKISSGDGSDSYNVSLIPVEPEDDNLFPPDCVYLYRLQDLTSGKIRVDHSVQDNKDNENGVTYSCVISTFLLYISLAIISLYTNNYFVFLVLDFTH